MSSNRGKTIVLAAAGSGKTEHIVNSAIAANSGRVLITTYTNENQRHILRRIEQKIGVVPNHITVIGWFGFLITQCAKPYQRGLTGAPFMIEGLNFKGRRHRYTRSSSINYFLDSRSDMYRDGVADFVVRLNRKTNGAVIDRLERIYSHIFIDEVQDLVGYDLDVLDLLLESRIKMMFVGDPRQYTYATNLCSKNKKYRGAGLLRWFDERNHRCTIDVQNYSYRCNQAICDFADGIYPDLPATISKNVTVTGHDGIFQVHRGDAAAYFRKHGPMVLRYDKKSDTLNLPAMNIGLSKGSTHDRVMVFPTQPMLRYLKDGDATKLKAPEKLYVAVTRARYSVAFVVPDPEVGKAG